SVTCGNGHRPSRFLHRPDTPPSTMPAYDWPVSEQTVLVVDDEEAIAEAVRARLENEGYRVVVALDGPEAIEAHLEHQPDLVVLDLMLPGMDGLEVCKQIQRDRWTPVLMLTEIGRASWRESVAVGSVTVEC